MIAIFFLLQVQNTLTDNIVIKTYVKFECGIFTINILSLFMFVLASRTSSRFDCLPSPYVNNFTFNKIKDKLQEIEVTKEDSEIVICNDIKLKIKNSEVLNQVLKMKRD